MATILCDDREDSVYDYLQGRDIEVIKKRIKTGDFNIKFNGCLALIIERKTWEDLASSIVDDRLKSQIANMMERKKEYNCRLLFVIEGGKPFRGDNVEVSGVKFKALKTKLRRLIIKYDIPHIFTKDHEDTADNIINLAKDYVHIFKSSSTVSGGDVNDADLFGVRKKGDEEIIRGIWCSLYGVSKESAHIYASQLYI
jgi:ERCC4-type nuclease